MTEPLFDIGDVVSTYSGKPGCCCGCKGTHTYMGKGLAVQRSGEYDPAKAERAARKILASPNAVRHQQDGCHDSHVVVETPTRVNIVYLRAGAR